MLTVGVGVDTHCSDPFQPLYIFSDLSPPPESNCTFFKFFTTGENAVMFQKTTQKSESRASSGLSQPLSHLLRPLPPFFIPLSLSISPASAPTLRHDLFFRPRVSVPPAPPLPTRRSAFYVIPHFLPASLHLPAAPFQPGHCLPCECLKSIPPTLHSSVSELPSNLSFHWQLHNVLRSRRASRPTRRSRRTLKSYCSPVAHC